jgi:folate-dependent tRNA-U54 methylase TrmFO/GidA
MSDKPETILDFDFGFTAVSEDELEVVRAAKEEKANLTSALASTTSKAQLLYDAIMPLLNNLKANPEKDYIYWPDRYDKLDAFADKLHDILTGD